MAPSEVKGGQRSKEEERRIHQALLELNIEVATFRDLLLSVGSCRDCPELRERIRRVRLAAVEAVARTNTDLLPHIKMCISEGTIIDNGQLICLYLLARLLERELAKCQGLVTSRPMAGMDNHFDKKSKTPASGGIGTMLTQIVMCTNVRPDFNAEERASVEKDRRELLVIVEDMADHLPREDPSKASCGLTCNEGTDTKWSLKRKRKKCSGFAHCCWYGRT